MPLPTLGHSRPITNRHSAHVAPRVPLALNDGRPKSALRNKEQMGGKKKTEKCGARVNSISRTPCICFLIELPSLSPSCNFYGPTRTRVHAFSWQRNGNLRVNFLYRIENRFSKITALSPSPPSIKISREIEIRKFNLTSFWFFFSIVND